MKKLKNKRKKLLINPEVQLAIIGFAIINTAISATIVYLSICYFFWDFKQTGIRVGIPTHHIFFTFLDDQKSFMNIAFLVSFFTAILVSFFGGILFSNKIVGPIYRMIQHLKEINTSSDKKLKKISFRKNDYFKELESEFNKISTDE